MVRKYAMRRSLIDVPNHRSSHTVPTPRGGGLAISLVVSTAVAAGVLLGRVDIRFGVAVLAGGGLIALIGWLDDHRSLAAWFRAAVHFAAAILAVALLGAPQFLPLPTTAGAQFLHNALAVVGLVWLTNLFNFMDGIDGVAGGEALVVTAVGAVLLLVSGEPALGLVAVVLGGATLGFLIWNWPPAKIFMGDVGSGFLGFVLGLIAVASSAARTVPLTVWLLLLGAFLYDATITLVRRLGRERFYEAHRRHAYQRAVQSGWSHRQVTISVLVIDLFLAACALIAWRYPAYRLPSLWAGVALLSTAYLLVERRRPMWQGSSDSFQDKEWT